MTSKIRFNPSTREVEIEGTEEFVEKYFKQIQDLFASLQEGTQLPAASAPARTQPQEAGRPAVRPALKKGEIFNAVVDKIREKGEGMTTEALMRETGFTQQQVRSVVFRAEKQGVIHRSRRGVYTAARGEAHPEESGEGDSAPAALPQVEEPNDPDTI